MATHPQSPKANAPSTLAMEPTIPTEAVVETELPVPESTEPVIREQDRLMPIANVVRVMRRMLPAHAKVADDAKEVIQECVSEFISFVTGEANDRCHGEHRKTVTAEDIVWAMERLGFDNYVAPLKSYIQRMRDSEGTGRVFGGRGDRAHQTRAPNGPAPVPMVALHGMRAQHVAFPNAALAHGYGVPIQVPFSVAPRFRAHQHVMVGGERSMAGAYYGAAKPVTDGNNGGGCAEGTSSSSSEEQPAAGTAPRLQYRN